MKIYKTIDELLENDKDCPFDIKDIPNNMGINLCNVKGIGWEIQEDKQLIELTIYFIPAN